MATITTDDVQHVATLARLEFNEEDIRAVHASTRSDFGLYWKIERIGYDGCAADVAPAPTPKRCQRRCR